MRIFLDASILFSAAKSAGAIRQLLGQLNDCGHRLVADDCVAIEARRNLARKAGSDAIPYLDALLLQIEVSHAQHSPQRIGSPQTDTDWLPEKDRPVLLAAIALQCDALVTGDRTDFGSGFGKTFGAPPGCDFGAENACAIGMKSNEKSQCCEAVAFYQGFAQFTRQAVNRA